MLQNRIRQILTEQDYADSLARIEVLMDLDLSPDEDKEFDMLASLIEDYEDRKFPMDTPDPIEVIKFRMEQLNLKQNYLVPIIGNQTTVSEVLSGKRELTPKMISSIHKHLNIPVELLLCRE